ncbi:MAG: multicopper oxidase domain-containing protein [Deltaproteobacteria bacterium]|nr:multicopper oxidase domain-containing protein [Deltaproteobacteria bacterium]
MRSMLLRAGAVCAGVYASVSIAAAQAIPFTRLNVDPTAANAAFPLQNLNGPSGANYQVSYPYPGQCLASSTNAALFPTLPLCGGAHGPSSFDCAAPGISNQSAGSWAGCGAPVAWKLLRPLLPGLTTPKFVWEVLNPPDYVPDKTRYPGADYYEIGLHEAWGFQALAGAGLFPNPPVGSPRVPGGMQWTGLTCNIAGGCTCPAGLSATFQAQYCPGGVIPLGAPLFTPIWGVGQINMTGGPVTTLLGGSGACSVTGTACNPTVIPTTCAPIPTGSCSVDLSACDPTVLPTTCATVPAPAPGGFCALTTAQACDPAVASTCPVDPATNLPEACIAVAPIAQTCNAGTPIAQTCNATAGNPFVAGPAAPWSSNNYVATWPSINIRASKGTPVVVKWVNEFPNNHVLCTHPDAADWPCSIDRTFMGVKATMDPAIVTSQLTGVPLEGVNRFGSPQQPDNSWVTHLHGGEIPPSTDGFAEKWFGNAVTAAMYNDPAKPRYVTPAFENPLGIALQRPAGNADTYAYPMVQEEATIWFHDHTLGKTHHNVIAGPAGFFPVKEPLKHGPLTNWIPPAAPPAGSEYTWLDPVTEPRDGLNIPLYDLFLAVQDRAFNDDGSINFSNGLGQTIPPPPLGLPGQTPVTAGVNPLVHPTWVPEYFGDHALVNGVIWPKRTVQPGWHRLRIVDGSDSRCYTFGFQRANLPPAPGAAVTPNVPMYVIANDQGYLRNPVRAMQLTMCPGERYELLVDFSNLPGVAPLGQGDVYMVNSAPAPFPVGISPQVAGSIFAHMNVLMAFQVRGTVPGVQSCGELLARAPVAPAGLTWNPANMAANLARGIVSGGMSFYSSICMPVNPALVTDTSFASIRPVMPPPRGSIVRQVYLNEKVDGVSLAPLGMQLNGVPFEYKVTETPKLGTREIWQFVNLTVDAHPMHPHLVKHQVVQRQAFNVNGYKTALCGAPGCMPGPAPGNEMQVVPDVTPFLTGGTGNTVPVTNASVEGGWKDATQAPPGFVTTIVADWVGRWAGVAPGGAAPTAPGTTCAGGVPCAVGSVPWTYEPVTSGPYVWHCHINSHEDSEMMRTSLVVP